MSLVKLPEEHEVPTIVNVIDQAPSVEGLDSRTSLSQLGENDANAGYPVQAHLESMEVECDFSFMGLFKSPNT